MSSQPPAFIDPRGPRFGAAITTVVLAVVLVTGNGWLLAAQAVVFAISAFSGLRYSPYGYVYRALVRPRQNLPLPIVSRQSRSSDVVALRIALSLSVGRRCHA